MKKETILFILSSILLFNACDYKKGIDVPIKKISPYSIVDMLSDSIYMTNVICLEKVSGNLFLSDYDYGVYKTDTMGRISEHFAKKGNAKGEALGSAYFYPVGDSVLYLRDDGHRCFSIYKDGRHMRNIKLSTKYRFSNQSRFFVHNDTIYHSIIGEDKLVAKISMDNTIHALCDADRRLDDKRMPLHSERHVLNGNHSIILVGKGVPLIQEFSYEGIELFRYDLATIPELSNTFLKERSNIPNRYFVVIKDAYYHNGMLYLLVASKDGEFHCNKIVALKKKEEEFVHMVSYQLKQSIYETFCVSGNTLYAFNSYSSAIEIYHLPD